MTHVVLALVVFDLNGARIEGINCISLHVIRTPAEKKNL